VVNHPTVAAAALVTLLSDKPQLAAPRLLGAVIRHQEVALRIVEVEAYDGEDDPASHCFGGRTARNASMYAEPGVLYVYRSYGVHLCLNLVCHEPGSAGGILLRAGEVIAGMDTVRRRRGPGHREVLLASGPGRLGQALGLTPETDGVNFLQDPHWDVSMPGEEVIGSSGPRIGISRAREEPWRFWVTGDPSVSGTRRHNS